MTIAMTIATTKTILDMADNYVGLYIRKTFQER